jgi:hypothetical protein
VGKAVTIFALMVFTLAVSNFGFGLVRFTGPRAELEGGRCRHFLLSGEQGLAGKKTLVNIFQDVLTLEYGDHPLSRYSVEWQPNDTPQSTRSKPLITDWQIVTAL